MTNTNTVANAQGAETTNTENTVNTNTTPAPETQETTENPDGEGDTEKQPAKPEKLANAKGFVMVPFSQIIVEPSFNDRQFTGSKAENKELDTLAENIIENGQIEAIEVTPIEGGYKLVRGGRRYHAIKRAIEVHETVPADFKFKAFLVGKISLADQIIRNFLSNEGKPYNFAEKARAVSRLDKLNYTVTEICTKLGLSQSEVSNYLAFFDAPKTLQNAVIYDVLAGQELVQLIRKNSTGRGNNKVVDYTAVENAIKVTVESKGLDFEKLVNGEGITLPENEAGEAGKPTNGKTTNRKAISGTDIAKATGKTTASNKGNAAKPAETERGEDIGKNPITDGKTPVETPASKASNKGFKMLQNFVTGRGEDFVPPYNAETFELLKDIFAGADSVTWDRVTEFFLGGKLPAETPKA